MPRQGAAVKVEACTACRQWSMKTPSASAGSLKLVSCTLIPCWCALRLAHARMSDSSTWAVRREQVSWSSK